MITREQVERIVADGPWNDRTRNSAGVRVCHHCDFLEPDHAEDCVWAFAWALLAADGALASHATHWKRCALWDNQPCDCGLGGAQLLRDKDGLSAT